MICSLIVAVADNHAIGKGNALPWHLPEDLKFFKRTTMGYPVIMGRKTFQSIGKPLPGRMNIVLSSDPFLSLPDGTVHFQDIDTALVHLKDLGTEEVFIIGGGKVYSRTMSIADRMYITRVHCTIDEADTFFPLVDHTHWKLTWQEAHSADDKHAHNYTFEKYERIDL